MEDLQAARRDPAQDTGVLVIGGGIGGLAAADALARAGHRVVLLEAGDWLGGMHHSVEIGPYSFDLGAIFYEETAALFDLAPGLRDLCPQVQRVQCRIDPEGTLCHYPIELRDLRRWPRARLAGAVAAMLAARLLLRRDGTLERACVNRLGPVFYRGTGLRDYVARFNVSPPEAIDEEFFVDRMRFVHRQTDFAAMARAGWNGLRHGAFRVKPRDPLRVRPRAGYGVLFERIRAQLEAAGGRVVLQAPVTRIEREASGRMVVTSPAGRFRVATVVGAAPLDTLHRAVFGTESGFESLSLMTLFVSAGRFAPGAGTLLFNFHGAGRWKRATFLFPDLPRSGDHARVFLGRGDASARRGAEPRDGLCRIRRAMSAAGSGRGSAAGRRGDDAAGLSAVSPGPACPARGGAGAAGAGGGCCRSGGRGGSNICPPRAASCGGCRKS
ncbi:FAD-dependent oxidoreductase [Rhodobacter capsulatus]|uniref:FAD-dependent oxidoreductase n=1 Tax=Rhodobacter capsulatus TaxID=1061 RepID=UPI0040298B72